MKNKMNGDIVNLYGISRDLANQIKIAIKDQVAK